MPSPTVFPATTVLWVALGGAIGSSLRFAISEWVRRIPALSGFPWATLGVNVTGSLALGAVAGWLMSGADPSPQLRAFVMIGVLGGYTTFSTFALEGLTMLHGGELVRASLYAVLSVVLSIAAAALGYALTRG